MCFDRGGDVNDGFMTGGWTKMEKYNIGKTARFLNISNELLRHYERLGLIEPERGKNGYRFFSFKEIDKLQGIRRYRNMDFSLEDMDKLIYTADYGEVDGLLNQALKHAERKLIWYQELARAEQRIIQDWRQIEHGVGKCEVTISRDILRIDLRHNDILDETIVTEETAEWIEKMPVVFISPYFCRKDILEGTSNVYLGYGIEAEAFTRLGMEHIAAEKCIRACRCVTAIVSSHGEESVGAYSLRPMVEYCRCHGLTISGDAWGMIIGNCSQKGESYRYHRIYLPVE